MQMNPSLQSLCLLCFTDCPPHCSIPSLYLPRDSCPNFWKRLEWRVLLQSGCSQPSHMLCVGWQTSHSSCSGPKPRAGPHGHLSSSIPRRQSWEIPLPVPALGGHVSCLCHWARDNYVGCRYRAPKVKGFRSHWHIILQADATGLFPDWAAGKVSVSRSDPKNRLLDASGGGRVCGCHPPHRPAPPDPARPQRTQVRPFGGEADTSRVQSSFWGAWVWGLEDPFPLCF